MLIGETLRVALQSIRANLFRSSLTMLGVIIGVAAVITIVALGQGASRAIQAQIAELGSNILTVETARRFRRGVVSDSDALKITDADALNRDSRYIQAVIPMTQDRRNLKFGNRTPRATVVGTLPGYPRLMNFRIIAGSMFTDAQNAGRKRVAVLASELVETELELKPEQIIGKTVTITAIPFQVIGVFQSRSSSSGPFRGNSGSEVWIPLETAQYRVTGSDAISSLGVQIADGVGMERAMVDIERVMRREHHIRPGAPNDFRIEDPTMVLTTQQQASQVLSFLLAGIAGVSLVVGGIGIMNIMLVTVTERTREIGVRLALGATRGNILLQFLVEAITLCLIGGAAGIALGAGGAYLMARMAGWSTYVSVEAVALAFAFSALVGLVFGIWPARSASRLNPIDALRYE